VNPSFVLDCSVTMALCFADEHSAYADTVLSHLKYSKALVPYIWQLEVANVLLLAEKNKRICEADVLHFSSLLSQLFIEVDDVPVSMSNLFLLGRSHQLTSYDACYLQLALIHGLPLATFDTKLKMAAREAGVSLYLQELLV
jgi:predicted nucleic acid-binding protein